MQPEQEKRVEPSIAPGRGAACIVRRRTGNRNSNRNRNRDRNRNRRRLRSPKRGSNSSPPAQRLSQMRQKAS